VKAKMSVKPLLPIFIILLLGITAAAASGNNTTTTNNNVATQVQGYAQKVPAPPSNFFQQILYYIGQGYNWLVGIIQNILQSTLLKQDPGLANTYANIIAWLIPLTAIYIILTFAEVLKKYLGYVIAAGWIFLIAVMILAH
jgi:hypothetical protein